MGNKGPTYVSDSNFHKLMRGEAVDISQFETSVCQGMFFWWQSFQPDVPRHDQFDILNHFRSAQNIFLINVIDKETFEYRVQGEEVIALIGRRNAGKVFSVGDEDKGMNNFAQFLSEMVEHKKAMHSYGTLEAHGKSYLKFEAFDFPLFDETGNVSHVVGVLTLID